MRLEMFVSSSRWTSSHDQQASSHHSLRTWTLRYIVLTSCCPFCIWIRQLHWLQSKLYKQSGKLCRKSWQSFAEQLLRHLWESKASKVGFPTTHSWNPRRSSGKIWELPLMSLLQLRFVWISSHPSVHLSICLVCCKCLLGTLCKQTIIASSQCLGSNPHCITYCSLGCSKIMEGE
jgi:hypothetical protein